MNTQIAAMENEVNSENLRSMPRRVAALVLDISVIAFLLMLPSFYYFYQFFSGITEGTNIERLVLRLSVTSIVTLCYFLYFDWKRNGSSIGKKSTGLLVHSDTTMPSFSHHLYRNAIKTTLIIVCFYAFFSFNYAYMIGALLLSYAYLLIPIIRKDQKALHDLAGKTKVVSSKACGTKEAISSIALIWTIIGITFVTIVAVMLVINIIDDFQRGCLLPGYPCHT